MAVLASLSRYRGDAGSTGARKAKLLFFLSVLVFASHNLEELHGIQSWARAAGPDVARLYARFDRVLVAIGFLTLVYAAVVKWAMTSWQPRAVLVMLLGVSTIVANGVVHVVARTMLGSSFPGLITASVLVIPMGVIIFERLVRDQILAWWQVPALIGAGLVLQAPLALLALKLAGMLI